MLIPARTTFSRGCEYYSEAELSNKNLEVILVVPDNITDSGFNKQEVETKIAALFGHHTYNDIHAHIHAVILSVHNNAEK